MVNREKCCWSGIVLGLAEKGDWAGAVQVDDTPRPFPKERKFEGMMSNDLNRAFYFQKLGEARAYTQGVHKALKWAREQGNKDRAPALLGVVDYLIQKDSRPSISS
jgi:hypothetical protein